jgi:hypothetical protein
MPVDNEATMDKNTVDKNIVNKKMPRTATLGGRDSASLGDRGA